MASVKPNKTSDGVNGGCHGVDGTYKPNDVRSTIPLGRCLITAGRLSHLISIAYKVQFGLQDVKEGPDWVWRGERFDVEGKAENPSTATEEQLLLMLQNLLAHRFRLKLHRETREVSGYALVVAKNGSKLKEVTGGGPGTVRMTGAAIYKLDAIERKNLEQNTILGQRASMSQLANVLSALPGNGPVADRTGLHAFYDFKLTWEPGELVTSVLQQQLGLRLEAQTIPVEVLVIDSAEAGGELMEPTAASEFIPTSMESPIAELRDFDKVVQLHWPRIFRFVLASVRDQDAAETLTQDCFWRAYRSRSRFRGDSSVNTWLLRIAVNLVRDFGRNRRLQFWRRALSSSVDTRTISDWVPDRSVSPEAKAVIREKLEAVWAATATLSERQRTVFLLRFVDDMDLLEIAAAPGLKEGAVKVHLFRALQSVRKQIGSLK